MEVIKLQHTDTWNVKKWYGEEEEKIILNDDGIFEYLLRGECDQLKQDEETLTERKFYDTHYVSFHNNITGLQVAYSNKNEKYSLDVFDTNDPLTIYFNSRKECATVMEKILAWKKLMMEREIILNTSITSLGG